MRVATLNRSRVKVSYREGVVVLIIKIAVQSHSHRTLLEVCVEIIRAILSAYLGLHPGVPGAG